MEHSLSFKIPLTTIFTLFIIINNAITWHQTGHMLVAQIAQNTLLQESPSIYESALNLLEPFSKFCGENTKPFIESATWPDKITNDTVLSMFNWHFSNQVISVDGSSIPFDLELLKFNRYNVTFQIDAAISAIQSLPNPKNQG